jgi:cellulose synthase/poly-beta-1,6-N-acetylglucosamine synthase-like glycosyltransferase
VEFVWYITIAYCIFLCWGIVCWMTQRETPLKQSYPKVSVLVAARNEEKHIFQLLSSLENQTYPKGLLELVLVDDQSTDNTSPLAQTFARSASFEIKYLKTKTDSLTPKKNALNMAVAHAEGELFLFTDADCTVSPQWISSLVSEFERQETGLVYGPIRYADAGFFEQMLSIEQAALLGSSLASLKLRCPSMCNGANMAVKRSVFEEVGGFETTKLSASGDDELLMHKVYLHRASSIVFAKSKHAIVETAAVDNLPQLYAQRTRWAGKWEKYLLWRTKAFALFVFLFHCVWLFWAGYSVFEEKQRIPFVLVLLSKIILEWTFARLVMDFLGKQLHLRAFFLLQVVYSPYVVFFALISRKKRFEWKGRKLA